jgi:iron complex outermembrane receptor protein
MSIRKATLFAGSMLFAVMGAASALAQTDQTQPQPGQQTQQGQPVVKKAPPGSPLVVVTGSRIRRTNFNTPAPVQVITTDEGKLQGLVGATAILQGSTAAAGYVQLNGQFSGFVINGGPGIESISLRGLGDQRTLVLLNGQRLNPAGVSGTVAAVDLNVIPNALVDRYEILKDGASSIYGSDAIGGVINIITRDKFDGINIETNDVIPTDGAGTISEIAVSGGRVRDNYHVLAGFEYYEQDAIRIRDLPGGRCPLELQRLPTGGPYNFGRSYADGSPYCANTQTDFVANLDTGQTFVYDATQGPAFPYTLFHQNGFGTVPRITNIATDPRTADVDALSPERHYDFTLLGGVDLPHGVEFYFEDLVTDRQSQQAAFLPQFFPATVPDIISASFSPFNPFPDFVQPVMTAPIPDNTQDVWAGRALFGLRGDFGGAFLSGWKWDTTFTYGFSRARYTTQAQLNSKVQNALNAVVAPPGTDPSLVRMNPVDGLGYTCAVNIANPGERCFPIDWFESSAAFASDPALRYIDATDHGHTDYDEIVFNGTADGPLFKLPAGDVQGVLGFEVRWDNLLDYPGRFGVARDYFNLSSAGVTKGSNSVAEVYAEGEAPLLKGMPLFDSLTLNLSGRYTGYQSGGSAGTYKVGVNWQVVPWLRFRATYGTSFRGPALFENFLAAQTSFTGANDPCAMYGANAAPGSNLFKNCASEGLPPTFIGYSATPEVFTQGAQGRLKSETSKNLTVGFVFQPSFADLQVSVTYFNIEVDNEIALLGASNILNLCYDSAQFRNGSPYCTLVSPRDSNNNIALINDSYLNVAVQRVSGVDFSVLYNKKFDFGTFIFDGEATYATEDNQELFPGSGFTNFTGTFGEPRWVADGQVRFRRGDWMATWTTNYLGPQSDYRLTGERPGGRYLESQREQFYHSVSISYDAPDKWKATLGVRNIFDKFPPVISNNPDAAFTPRVGEFANGYGNLNLFGRSIFVSVSKDF